MQGTGENESIANIAVDSMIWSEPQSLSQNREISALQIYTVSKNIKNPQILEHIKPDYGSLGQFMKNVAISKDILLHNRKKKNELQDDIEQKKMRATLKDKNLDKVIKQPTATQLQKTIASKMIVQNLFENKFGTTLQNFCSQNNKHESNNHSYSSIAELTAMFDDLMTRTKDDSIARYSELKNELPVLIRNKNHISAKEMKTLSFSERYEKLKSIQKGYTSLKKLKPFELTINEELSHTSIVYQSFVISQNITSYNLLAAQLVKIQLSKVRSIRLINVNFSYDLFCAFLTYFTDKYCYALRQLVIQKCNFGNCEKVALRVKDFIEQTSIYRVELTDMGMSSRDFCIICLGVGSRNSFGEISMRSNKVGEIAKKCLDVLLKFNKQVKLDLSNNPIQKEIKGKPGYLRCFG